MSTAEHPGRPAGSEPTGQRIGDVERDRAVNALSEHLASGRLDRSEFDERMTGALHARTHADLEPLFLDLPEPRPVSRTFSPAAQARPVHPHYTTPSQPPHASQVSDLPHPDARPGVPSGRRRRYPYALGPAIWCAAIALVVISGGHLWWMMIVAVLVMSRLWGGGCGRRRRMEHPRDRTHRRIES